MIDFLDRKLAENGLARQALADKDARTLFRLALEACVGIREVSDNAGPMVELIQETVGGADKEPWCMSLVQTGLAYAEHKTGIRSPVAASEHCMTVWNTTRTSQRVKKVPALGAIIIWRHGAGPAGHTGIAISPVKGNMFETVEGNTAAGLENGEIVREGGGVYLNRRSMGGQGNMKLVGFIKPF